MSLIAIPAGDRCSGELPADPDPAHGEIERTDIVIVAAMAVEEGWETGRHPELVDWLRCMHERGAMSCSACTGLGLLPETELLDGRQATAHRASRRASGGHFPHVDLFLDEVLVTAGERGVQELQQWLEGDWQLPAP